MYLLAYYRTLETLKWLKKKKETCLPTKCQLSSLYELPHFILVKRLKTFLSPVTTYHQLQPCHL